MKSRAGISEPGATTAVVELRRLGGGQGKTVSKASEYRKLAAECLQIANNISVNGERARLMEMAQKWLELAQKAEAEEQPGAR
jgi:hypothetical protein